MRGPAKTPSPSLPRFAGEGAPTRFCRKVHQELSHGRREQYALEARWPASAFWQRRR
jgi:hypothetical protein